jgi:hypothetical protein
MVSFSEGCESSPVRNVDFYCACALKAEMRRHPDAKSLLAAGGAGVAGELAAMNQQDFPDCAGK